MWTERRPLLEVRGLTTPGPQGLFDVTLHAAAAEVTLLVATQADTASMLLRAVMGLSPSTGRILMDGHELSNVRTEDTLRAVRLALVPPGTTVHPNLRVVDNLRAGLHLERNRARRRELLSSALQMFPELAERRNLRARVLPLSIQRLLAVARSMLFMPRLLLWDQPDHGLAPDRALELVRRVQDAADGIGCTVLATTTDPELLVAVTDRVLWLHEGVVAFDGVASEWDPEMVSQP